uniref:ABC transporter permease n=1 Tax=Thermococcus peptonophilus TaxID=53952 RepID=UPI000A9FEBDD
MAYEEGRQEMNPVWNLALKELYVSVKSKRFVVIFGLYFIIFGLAVYAIKDYLVQMGVPSVESNELSLWGVSAEIYTTPLAILFTVNMMIITVLGAVLGAALGADAINREVESGTVRVLLGHPVYRDEIINGKFLGMGLLIAVTYLVSYLIMVAAMLLLGIPLDGESLFRGLLGDSGDNALHTGLLILWNPPLNALEEAGDLNARRSWACDISVFYGIVVGIVAPKLVGPEPPIGTSAYQIWADDLRVWMNRLHSINPPAHHYVQLVSYIFAGDRFFNYYIPLSDSFTYGFNNLAALLVMLLLP